MCRRQVWQATTVLIAAGAAIIVGVSVFAVGSAPTQAGGAAGQAPGYVGEATCLTCHDTQAETLKGTPHARKNYGGLVQSRTANNVQRTDPRRNYFTDEGQGPSRSLPTSISRTCSSTPRRGSA